MSGNVRKRRLNSQPQSEWYSMFLVGMVRTKSAVICRRPDPTKAELLWKQTGKEWWGGGYFWPICSLRQYNKRALINLIPKITLKIT